MSTDYRRSYSSPAREEGARRTRLSIIGAAHRLFAEHGFAGTSIRAIAETAGVAESTVYHVFGDKPSLLWAIVEHVVGEGADLESQGAALIEELRSSPDPDKRLRIIARWSRGTYERGIAQIEAVIEEAARSDPNVQALAHRAAEERYRFTRLLADVVAEVLPSVDTSQLDQIAQFVWATDSSPVYRMLVEQQGWTPDQFEDWIYRLYRSVLPPLD
jgi:AcrR family transcriptional regulator